MSDYLEYLRDDNLLIGVNGEIFVLKYGHKAPAGKDYALNNILKHPAQYPELDIPATKTILSEVPPRKINIDRDAFVNELNRPLPQFTDTPDKKYFNSFPEISDDFIANFAQKTGLSFCRKDVYSHARYNEKTGAVEYTDAKGNPVETPSLGLYCEHKITIFNEIISMSLQDYQMVTQIDAQIMAKEKENPAKNYWDLRDEILENKSPKEKAMFKVFQSMKEKDVNVKKTILHELKHFKTNFLLESRQYKNNSKNLEVANIFAKNIEDERSASFEETMFSVNTYLENGNYDDFSMFNEDDKLIVLMLKKYRNSTKLSAETKQEKIFSFLGNHPKLLASSFSTWNDKLDDYKDDITTLSSQDAKKQPCLKATEKNDEEYRILRSIMYSYKVFDPRQKKYEYKDLSKEIMVLENGNPVIRDTSQNLEPLKSFINIPAVFRDEIAKISKERKVKEINFKLDSKNVPSYLLSKAKNLSRKHFHRTSCPQKTDYVTTHVLHQAAVTTMCS